MAFLDIIASILLHLWTVLKHWLFIVFVSPFRAPDMFWVLLPVYAGWFFSEFFQEKEGTSLGNAISNSVVVFYGGIDWIRTTIKLYTTKALKFGWLFTGKIFVSLLVIGYGIWIIYSGLHGKEITRYIGRIREVTYVIIMLTPLFYGAVSFSFLTLEAIILMFPLFYLVVEAVDRYVPNPQAVEMDKSRTPSGRSGRSLGNY